MDNFEAPRTSAQIALGARRSSGYERTAPPTAKAPVLNSTPAEMDVVLPPQTTAPARTVQPPAHLKGVAFPRDGSPQEPSKKEKA